MNWLLPVALVLLLAGGVRSGRRMQRRDIGLAAGAGVLALLLRIVLGPWGPLRVNGLAPMWLDGAISDPGQVYGYGPGYPELFSFIARGAPSWPDTAIFAANGVLSAIAPPLAFALARLFGMDRTRATAGAALLALDPVAIRMATTESYMPAIIALTAAAAALLVAAALRAGRAEWRQAVLFALAAGLVLSQSVRIHPLAWIPAALAPLAALAAGEGVGIRVRLLQAAGAWLSVTVVVGLTGGRVVFEQLRLVQESEVMAPSGPAFVWWFPALAAALAIAAVRWARPFWPFVPALLYLGALAATRHDFAQSWIWQQSYARLYFVLPVVAAVTFVRQEWFRRRAVQVAVACAAAVLLVASRPILGERTTDHLEYRWVRGVVADIAPECLILYVGQVGKRNMMLPIFGAPARPARKAVRIDGNNPGNLAERLRGAPCTYYVRTSLCSSTDARPACNQLENKLELEPVAAEHFPAVPSNDGMPYDRAQVETAVYRVGRVR